MRRILLGMGLVWGACGAAAKPCTVESTEDGVHLWTCPDGSTATLTRGQDGAGGRTGRDGAGFGEVVEGSFLVENDADLAAIAEVKEFTGWLEVDLRRLTEVDLPKLERVGSDLEIAQGGLSVAGGMRATGDFVLSLSGLTEVGGDFEMYGIPQVTNLEGFSALTTVGGDLYLSYLPDLESLSGLESLAAFEGDITIQYNSKLCKSLVIAFADHLHDDLGWSGTLDQTNNDDGC